MELRLETFVPEGEDLFGGRKRWEGVKGNPMRAFIALLGVSLFAVVSLYSAWVFSTTRLSLHWFIDAKISSAISLSLRDRYATRGLIEGVVALGLRPSVNLSVDYQVLILISSVASLRPSEGATCF